MGDRPVGPKREWRSPGEVWRAYELKRQPWMKQYEPIECDGCSKPVEWMQGYIDGDVKGHKACIDRLIASRVNDA